MYVFDASPFSTLFRNYYLGRFPTLWRKFDALVANGKITSTREVKRELEQFGHDSLQAWINKNLKIFSIPTPEEILLVRKIFEIQHFQQNIQMKKLLKGGNNADPFVVAKAMKMSSTVVTIEKETPNGAKIPNICRRFHVKCCDLEGFMKKENWIF